jgi:glycosyltransferase involved in cell wall biosynthesis
MRVVLVTHYYPAHGGGVEVVAGHIARRLAEEGDLEIAWHASDCDPAPAQDGVHLRCVPAATWNGIEARLGLPYPVWSWASLRRLVREVRDADLVHLHDCLYLGNIVAFIAARMSRRPVVVTQHIGHVPFSNPALRILLSMANRLLGNLVLGGACRVVFIAQTVRAYFAGFVRFRAAPLAIANGVDCALFRPAQPEARAALRSRLGAGENQPVLLFVGRFVEKKGLALIRQLTGLLPEALWLFAGAGPLDPAHWSASNVRVLGRLAQAELVPLYQAADLLVLPSFGEGFPLVVQEAMACGTPALVDPSTARAWPKAADVLPAEAIEGADAAQRWAACIRMLVTASSHPQRRAAVARFAVENWSWDASATRHAQAMRECAS